MDENLFWSAGHCGLKNEKEEREGVERGVGGLSRLLGAAVNSSFVPGLPAQVEFWSALARNPGYRARSHSILI